MPFRERASDPRCVAEHDALIHNARAYEGVDMHYCMREHAGWVCTRPHGHSGTVHVATGGGGHRVYAKWDDSGEEYP